MDCRFSRIKLRLVVTLVSWMCSASVLFGQVGVVKEFALANPGSCPAAIVYAPDGAFWSTDCGAGKIIRLTTDGGLKVYPLPTRGAKAADITLGPDAALWFTESIAGADQTVDKIGRITTAGAITEYPLSDSNSGLTGITTGPDGAIWFTEELANKIGRITTAGTIIEYPVPTRSSRPGSITAGPDGALWFTEWNGNSIGRITVSGTVTEYRVPTSDALPSGITAGADGSIWFLESAGDKVGRITPAGVITEYLLATSGNWASSITAGQDGALWFTESNGNRIGHITTAGVITEYAIPTDNAWPFGILQGPGNTIWFTETVGGRIGRLSANPPNTIQVRASSETASFTVTGPVTLSGRGKLWSRTDVPPGDYSLVFDPASPGASLQLETKRLAPGGAVTFGSESTSANEQAVAIDAAMRRFTGLVSPSDKRAPASLRSSSPTPAILTRPRPHTPIFLAKEVSTYTAADKPLFVNLDELVVGGISPFTWSLQPGSSLPDGVELYSGISGAPGFVAGATSAPAGTYKVALKAVDAIGETYGIDDLKIIVQGSAINEWTLPNGMTGATYSATLTSSGGTPPYTFELSAGFSLPSGFTLSSAGVLEGTPTHAGLFPISVQVTDSLNNAAKHDMYNLVVDSANGDAPGVSIQPASVQLPDRPGGAIPSAVPVDVNMTSGRAAFTAVVAGIPGASLSTNNGAGHTSLNLLFDTIQPVTSIVHGVIVVSAPDTANGFTAIPVTLDAPAIATMNTPAPGSTLGGATVTFNWTSAAGATAYWLDVGTVAGQGNISGMQYSSSTTSATISGIPTNGSTIYVKIWTLQNGAWTGNSYTYTASGSSNTLATMSSPTPGSTLGGATVTFSWTAASGASAYWLDVGTVAGQGNISGMQYSSSTTSATISGIPTNGSTIYVKIWTLQNGAWTGNSYTYTASGSSNTLATMSSPTPGSTLGGATVTFSWTAASGASAYWLDVGTVAGQGNISGMQYSSSTTSATISGIPTNGSTIYVKIWTLQNGAWTGNSYTYTASGSSNTLATLSSPTPGSTFSGSSVTFTWTAASGASAYWLDVGTVAGQGNISGMQYSSSTTSATISGIPTNGSTIYVKIWTLQNGVWTGNSYTYTASGSSNTLATMSSPTPGSTLGGATVTFSWTAASGATAYWLDVGTVAGQGNISGMQYSSSTTSVTVSGIPTNGSTIYVKIWTLRNGAWTGNSYTYTASGSSNSLATMSSPTPGSTLGGATVTFSWTAASGATAYWLDVGTVAGQGNISGMQYSSSTTSVTVSGIPTNGSTIFVKIWTLQNGAWTGNSYTYTAATVVGTGTMTVANATIGQGLQVPIAITFMPTVGATAGATQCPSGAGSPGCVTIVSNNPSLIMFKGPGTSSTASLTAPVPAGTDSISVFVQAVGTASAGTTATLTASFPGYANATATITYANSGFVVSGPNGIGGAFNTFQGVQTTLTVSAARLDSTGLFVENEQVIASSNLSIPIASTTPSVGNVSPTLIQFSGGTSSTTVTFTASGVNSGATSVILTQPNGFTNPVVGGSLTANVASSGLIAPSGVVVGKNLQISANVTLSGNATQLIPVTLTSSDSTKLQFACPPQGTTPQCTPSNGASSPTITVNIPQNSSTSADFFVRAYDSAGSVQYTVSSPSFGSVSPTPTMPLAPSGFVIQTPGNGFGDFNMTTSSLNATLNVFTAAFPSSGGFVLEAVAGDQSVSATVTSSSTAVGTITASPVTIGGGQSSATTSFHALTVGTSNITASSAGYTPATVKVTVLSNTLSINNSLTVGQHLEVSANVFLSSAVASAGGLDVTLSVDAGSIGRFQLAVNSTDAGSNAITVHIPQGGSAGSYWIYGLLSSGSGTYTASAPGYGTSTPDTTFLAPSAVIIVGPGGQPGSIPVSSTAGPQSVTVITDQLSTDGNNTPIPGAIQALAGGVSLSVLLGNSNGAAGTLSAASVTIVSGTSEGTVTFTPKAVGNATISVTEPSGWTMPGLYAGSFDLTQFLFQVQ